MRFVHISQGISVASLTASVPSFQVVRAISYPTTEGFQKRKEVKSQETVWVICILNYFPNVVTLLPLVVVIATATAAATLAPPPILPAWGAVLLHDNNLIFFVFVAQLRCGDGARRRRGIEDDAFSGPV